MRRSYMLLAIAAFLSGVLSAATDSTQNKQIAVNGVKEVKTAGTTGRLLRQYNEVGAKDTEERVAFNTGPIALNSRMVNRLASLEKKAVDPKLADDLLEGTVLKEKLDAALSATIPGKIRIFEGWHKEGVDPKAIIKVLNMHPAMEKKYRFVYTLYEDFVKSEVAKRLAKLKRKRID